MDYFIYQAMI